MNRIATVAACCLLASCGAAGPLTRAMLPAETVSTMRSACDKAGPLFALARLPLVPAPAGEIAAVVEPYCLALASGQLPATTDSNSPSWLAANLRGLAAGLGR